MSRLEDLTKLAPEIREWIDDAPADRKAALIAQYRATLAEIDALTPKEAEGDGIDEVARRRAARRSGPASRSDRAKQSS